ncbi:MAG: hypothetical protein AVDCRST_MAG08-3738, partial [uncultured Acetobacteraceae bacterium]
DPKPRRHVAPRHGLRSEPAHAGPEDAAIPDDAGVGLHVEHRLRGVGRQRHGLRVQRGRPQHPADRHLLHCRSVPPRAAEHRSGHPHPRL